MIHHEFHEYHELFLRFDTKAQKHEEKEMSFFIKTCSRMMQAGGGWWWSSGGKKVVRVVEITAEIIYTESTAPSPPFLIPSRAESRPRWVELHSSFQPSRYPDDSGRFYFPPGRRYWDNGFQIKGGDSQSFLSENTQQYLIGLIQTKRMKYGGT